MAQVSCTNLCGIHDNGKSFTHQQARTLLFCARSEKTSVPLLHLRCRGWVGGSPLSLEPTEVKHYAREARLPRFTHQQARTLLFCARSEKTSVPLLHLRCTPPPSHPSLHQLGLSVTKRDTTRTEGGVRTGNLEALRRWGSP